MASRKGGPTMDIKAKKGVSYKADTRGKKINHSYFACLFNTNYKPKTKQEIEMMGQAYPEVLEQVLNEHPEVFKRAITVVDRIVTHRDRKKTFETHTIGDAEYDENIRHIRSRFKAELGNDMGKGGRLHLHASFFIVHTTKIQLNLEPIVTLFNQALERRGLPTIKYYHVKSEKPSTDLYMTKYNYA